MKALVLEDAGQFVYRDWPDPQPADDEVVIRVKACGICGSDVHGMDGSTGRRRPPVIMGHEASGIIESVGADVVNWGIGDRVTFDSTIYCGACDFCQRGAINLCESRRVLGVSCEEYTCHGAMAERVAVPERVLYRLPDGVTFEQGAMVEPLSVALHAVGRAKPSAGAPVVVIGTGIIGLLVVQVLRAKGCGSIMAVDMEDEKLEVARRLGAETTLNAGSCDVVAEVMARTGGVGAAASFDVVGRGPTLATAVGCTAKGGTVALVGNLDAQMNLPLQSVVTREQTLVGSCASRGEYPECLEMMARGDVDVDALISAVVPLAEGGAWFDRLYAREKNLLKVILRGE